MSSFSDHFKSYYLSPTTHWYPHWEVPTLPSESAEVAERQIDVEKAFEKHCCPEEVNRRLQEIITDDIYTEILNDQVVGRFTKAFYEQRGFTVLKAGHTLVLEHESLPGCLIKSSVQARNFLGSTITGDAAGQKRFPIAYTNLLRASGREHYQELNENEQFTFPEEYLYRHSEDEAPLHRRFFAISEKVEVLTPKESLEAVRRSKRETQLKVVNKVCAFIEKTGFPDLHAGNLLLTKDGKKFYLIDLEPLGHFVEKDDERGKDSLLSHEMRVISSLTRFRDAYCLQNDLFEMADAVEQKIEAYLEKCNLSQNELIGHDQRHNYLRGRAELQPTYQTVLKILATIPFFIFVLPILAIRAGIATYKRQSHIFNRYAVLPREADLSPYTKRVLPTL